MGGRDAPVDINRQPQGRNHDGPARLPPRDCLAPGRPLITEVSGTPAKLHANLTEFVGKKIAASADWPKSSTKFGNELRQLAPQLRLHGLSVGFERRNEGRIITLKSERAPTVPSHGTAKPGTS